jgi:hypothetical protein
VVEAEIRDILKNYGISTVDVMIYKDISILYASEHPPGCCHAIEDSPQDILMGYGLNLHDVEDDGIFGGWLELRSSDWRSGRHSALLAPIVYSYSKMKGSRYKNSQAVMRLLYRVLRVLRTKKKNFLFFFVFFWGGGFYPQLLLMSLQSYAFGKQEVFRLMTIQHKEYSVLTAQLSLMWMMWTSESRA